MHKKITIVEDDAFMREELAHIFEKAGYTVSCVESFENTAETILHSEPNLVLLDVNLPGSSGFQICEGLKQRGNIPVMMLTSRDQMKDEIHALDLGADEYLTKPCHKERLLARAENLLRRFEGREHLLCGSGFWLDENSFTLYVGQKSVVLPENQGRILLELIRHPGETVDKRTLCHVLWGTDEYIDENALQVNLTRLKKTLEKYSLAGRIENVRGVGYRLLRE